jgi:primosomal protein N' (replication factor Y)
MTSVQRNLFADAAAPWEEDDADDQLLATIVFAGEPRGTFDYLVPDEMRDTLKAGMRVRVPLGRGNRRLEGYCVEVRSGRSEHSRLKAVAEVVDQVPLLSPAMLDLAHWIAERYLCPLGPALETIVPAGVRQGRGTRAVTFVELADGTSASLEQLKLPKKQAALVSQLIATPGPVARDVLLKQAGCSSAPLKNLHDKGVVRFDVRRVRQSVAQEESPPREQPLVLNDSQQQALQSIIAALESQQHQTIVLYGVTGSGKTEVYIQAIDRVVSFGRQAIVLVPEISLTPQTCGRFRSRFDNVAVLHSHMSDVERHDQWARIASGEVQVVVGARSAVFAPMPQLGLIVIDEEHESTFKQETAPRYHARDVAIQRALRENVPVVLGSATPALETWHHATTGDFQRVDLPHRVLNRPMPRVRTIDLRLEQENRSYRGAISRPLSLAIERTLADDGQVILLLNRRGFSTHIQCPKCGEVARCPGCDVSLTFYREASKAICHYCDYSVPPPTACNACDFVGIRFSGFGTERLEGEVRRRFPSAACLRMDADTMRRHGSHAEALAKFRSGEVQILLGTQMIAKGLDFPNVTLVGVVNADVALHLPDFRAAERTFQLIAQVAGRTGRGEKGGEVLVQTYSPEHPAVQAAVRHDFELFATGELPSRQRFGYPPHAALARLVFRGTNEELVRTTIEEMARRLREELAAAGDDSRVLGPAPAPIARLRERYRYHLQIHGSDRAALAAAVRSAGDGFELAGDVQWIVDIDPVSML